MPKAAIYSSADNDKKPANTSSTSQSSQNSNQLISKDEAKSIALKDAGLEESDIYDFEIEYDNDGIRKYEIEFKAKGLEYSYDINAKTGIIIKKEIDND